MGDNYVTRILASDGNHYDVTDEYRVAGPFEYYLDPYLNRNDEPIVHYAGELKTEGKVVIVKPASKIKVKTWSNH